MITPILGLFVNLCCSEREATTAEHTRETQQNDAPLLNLVGRYMTVYFIIPSNLHFKFHTSYPNMSFIARHILNSDILIMQKRISY